MYHIDLTNMHALTRNRKVPRKHAYDCPPGSESTAEDNVNRGQQQNLSFIARRLSLDPSGYAVLATALNILMFLLPTFITASAIRPPAVGHPRRKTLFLDGVRGIAAIMVTTYHHMNRTSYSYGRPYYLGPYGPGEDAQDFTSLAQLPIIRVFCSGGSGVAVFFVISGYLLSVRPVQIIRQVEREADPSKRHSLLGTLVETLFSSIIRRGVRLFLPCIIVTFIFECMDAIGVFHDHFEHAAPGLWGYVLHFWHILDTLFAAIFNVDGGKVDVLRQLWTVPTEFACSMALFVVIIGISRLSTRGRVICLTGLMGFAFYYDHNGLFAYISGIFVAEIEEALADFRIVVSKDADFRCHHQAKQQHELLSTTAEKGGESMRGDQRPIPAPFDMGATWLALFYKVFWNTLLLVSLYIFGWPFLRLEREPLLFWADSVLGRERSRSLAAFAFVNCLFRLPWLQNMFQKPFAIYLGTISFSIYCVHFSLIIALEKGVSHHVGNIFGMRRLGHANRFFANTYEAALMLCAVIWVGDLFWRLGDIPTIKLARWIEQRSKVECSS